MTSNVFLLLKMSAYLLKIFIKSVWKAINIILNANNKLSLANKESWHLLGWYCICLLKL